MPLRRPSTTPRPKKRRQSDAVGTTPPPGERDNEKRSEDRGDRMLIVGIGASAGGLEAFTELLTHLPLDTGLGFVLVQHLDPQHQSALTQLLTRATSMPVREVVHNLRVEANHVYVIPPNTNLGIAQGLLTLQPRQQTHRPVRSIDTFFESLAQDQHERAIGVILSGTATDGTMGLEAIKAEGGITFAQDESAKYDSMPRSAVAAGCVDFVLRPEAIARELARIAKHPYIVDQPRELISTEAGLATATTDKEDDRPLPSSGHGMPQTEAKDVRGAAKAAEATSEENGYKTILLLLRNHSGVDFSLYKSSTIQRRITRRMVLNKQDTLEEYSHFLRGNAIELAALYSDVLISVTSFFRNPEAFDVLTQRIFPKLLQQRGGDPLRVWVLGCSTGQEAYSIAMAFMESSEHAPRARKLQVFATDLNEALLDKARHGLYAKSVMQGVSPGRLRRFFSEEEGGYRVAKALREMVVFARQNLISDPPFSRMDLISCRNLLIYLEPGLQKKAIATFHYALKPEGFLFLGASESIGPFIDLFEPVDKKHKIYAKKPARTQAFHLPVKRKPGERHSLALKPSLPMAQGRKVLPDGLSAELSSQREADRVTVNRFAPPGVLINAELQILQFRGRTDAYLQPPHVGRASFDVLKMAREGLMLPLRAAINKAKKDNKTARREHILVQQNGMTRTVNVEVIPLKNLRERCFLILFEDAEQVGHAVPRTPSRKQPSGVVRTASPGKQEESRRLHAVEAELAETRDYLQSFQEQHEAAIEELQASNEEVQSANEELQSLNEELETSKEELESTNEELITVNEEMAYRNIELSRLNADLSNLHVSVNMAILVVARDLTIRRFTAPAAILFNLLATDVGRPVSGVRHNLVVPNLSLRRKYEDALPTATENETIAPFPVEALLREVIDSVSVREREVRDKNGRWYILRARPYMTEGNKVDGAVAVLVDIHDLKRAQVQSNAAREYAEGILRTVRDPMIVLRADLCVNTANDAFYKMFKATPEQTEGRLIYDLGNGQWKIPKLRRLLEDILPRNSFFNDVEITQEFPHIGKRTMLLNARKLDLEGDTPQMILLAIEDITERKLADDALRTSEERFRTLFSLVPVAVYTCDVSGAIQQFNRCAAELWGREPARGETGERFCGSYKLFRPDGSVMPHEQCPMAQVVAGTIPAVHDAEVLIERPDGSRVTVIVNICPLKNEEGEVTGAINCFYDITERTRAEEALRQSHAELRSQAEELTRFNRAAVGRELRMIELKKEINELCQRHGEPVRYTLEFEQGIKDDDD